MKNFSFLLISVLFFSTPSLSRAAWTLEDSYLEKGFEFSFYTKVSVAPDDHIFGSVINIKDQDYWMVRGYDSNTFTWNSFDYVDAASPWGVLALKGGKYFAVGSRNLENGTTTWLVRKGSTTSKAETVHEFQLKPDQSSLAVAITSLSDSIYVVGRTRSDELRRWTVTKSQDDGATWSFIDFYIPTDAVSAMAYSAATSGTSNIFVAGKAAYKDGIEQAIVRRSLDSGKTWETTLAESSDDLAYFRNVTASDSGVVAAAGSLQFQTPALKRIISVSRDFGKTWVTHELPKIELAKSESLFDVAIGPNDELYAATSAKIDGLSRWIILMSTDYGNTWTYSDFYQTSGESRPWGIATSENGDIYAAGHCGEEVNGQFLEPACIRKFAP